MMSGLFALLAFFLSDLSFYSAVGTGIIVYTIINYVEALGKSTAIIEMASLIMSLQLILGPIFAYQLDGSGTKYRMYVSEDIYMPFAVCGVFAFLIGSKLFNSKVYVNQIIIAINNHKINRLTPYVIIFIGLTSNFISSLVPNGLAFIFFFFSQFQFIAILYLFVIQSRLRWAVGTIVIIISFLIAAEEGMFHTIILWAGLIFSFVCLQLRLTRLPKYAVLAVAVFALSSLQLIKSDFRDKLWTGQVTGSAGLALISMMGGEDAPEVLGGVSQLEKLNIRLNQGWVVSAVMRHVPESRPYAGGATIKQAVVDTLVPRFVLEKRSVAVGDAFRQYTGLPLGRETSIGIGLLGEAWANYGWWGCVLMGAWGAMLSGFISLILRYSKKIPTLVLWIPFLLLLAIKAETEFVMTLNYLFKSSVFLASLYGFLRIVLGIKM